MEGNKNCDQNDRSAQSESEKNNVSEIKDLQEFYPELPTDRFDRYYNMKHKKRGLAYIFSHEVFDILPKLADRTGTSKDCNDFKEQLENLDFEVKVFVDQTFPSMCKELKEASEMDHSENDCLLICVMTHGEKNSLCARDGYYKPDLLWLRFTAEKCPTLAGKPKIVIIQACRGSLMDSGKKVYSTFNKTDGNEIMQYNIPNHADFFIGYSTIPDYLSWRDPLKGSWYIQSLVEVLKVDGKKEDFFTLMTMVSQKVAYDRESKHDGDTSLDKKKQIPSFVSMFTRLLRFEEKPKSDV